MRLLLDTHVVLWQLSCARVLSDAAREAIADADDMLFSVVSFAEVGVKAAVGKLVIPDDFQQHVAAAGLRTIGISADHGLAVAKLPAHRLGRDKPIAPIMYIMSSYRVSGQSRTYPPPSALPETSRPDSVVRPARTWYGFPLALALGLRRRADDVLVVACVRVLINQC